MRCPMTLPILRLPQRLTRQAFPLPETWFAASLFLSPHIIVLSTLFLLELRKRDRPTTGANSLFDCISQQFQHLLNSV